MKHPPAEPLGDLWHGITFSEKDGKVMPVFYALQERKALETGGSYAFCKKQQQTSIDRKEKGKEMSSPHGVRCAPLPEWDYESIRIICRNQKYRESL